MHTCKTWKASSVFWVFIVSNAANVWPYIPPAIQTSTIQRNTNFQQLNRVALYITTYIDDQYTKDYHLQSVSCPSMPLSII